MDIENRLCLIQGCHTNIYVRFSIVHSQSLTIDSKYGQMTAFLVIVYFQVDIQKMVILKLLILIQD